ncbi:MULTISPECIES: hypothetical protein [unclassified Mameliella]|uniref:hypothetical protein n=1 Tax=unclassified Mameliella TaxID=2630630 RepID=UPI00273EF2CF|nr:MULTISPECIES: hypothetical protein [unclassified Mameliella]
MKFNSTIAPAAVADSLSTDAMAQDIAVSVGSAQDRFWNMVKKGAEDAALMVEAMWGTVNFLQT